MKKIFLMLTMMLLLAVVYASPHERMDTKPISTEILYPTVDVTLSPALVAVDINTYTMPLLKENVEPQVLISNLTIFGGILCQSSNLSLVKSTDAKYINDKRFNRQSLTNANIFGGRLIKIYEDR